MDDFVAWSGWVLSVLGLIGTVYSIRLALVERNRSARLASTLSRASMTRQDNAVRANTDDARMQMLLIKSAADGNTFRQIAARASRMGIDEKSLRDALELLKRREIVQFDGPPSPDTVIALKV